MDIESKMKVQLGNVLDSLTDRERAVLAMRTGEPVPSVPFATGDRVLYVRDMPREVTIADVHPRSGRVRLSDNLGTVDMGAVALLPPDADGDLVAVANVLQGALVAALRRRTGIHYAAHGPVFLMRVTAADLALDGSGSDGFIAACALARRACYGETPREALRWLASELWHQLDALESEPEFGIVRWAFVAMDAVGTIVAANRFRGDDAGADMRAAWLAEVDLAARASRATA